LMVSVEVYSEIRKGNNVDRREEMRKVREVDVHGLKQMQEESSERKGKERVKLQRKRAETRPR
jgi:hypothetical protein